MHNLPYSIVELITEHLQDKSISIKPLKSDASARRYYRIYQKNTSFIWMDLQNCPDVAHPFIKITNLLSSSQILCPKIHFHCAQGLLIDDLGASTFEDHLSPHCFEPYTHLQPTLVKLATLDHHPSLPLFSCDLIRQELSLFTDWYLPLETSHPITTQHRHQLQGLFQKLSENMIQQPQCFVHRDLHCRNIMMHNNQATLIDYQDAVVGPITYDAVSLLKDCYITIPRHIQLNQMKNLYHSLNPSCSYDQWIEWFDLTGLQRHLKVLGIFTRLKHRDRKPDYCQYFPRIRSMISSVIEDHPQFNPIEALLDTKEMIA